MRLWPRKQAKTQLAREVLEAEAARQKAREHQAHARARGPAVDRLVAQLKQHRNAGPMSNRIQAALTSSIVDQLAEYSRELRDEAGRSRDQQ